MIALHNHSEYSLSDSILRIEDLVAYAKADGQTALALTDRNNAYGLVKFYKAARGAGIKPILGCDLSVRNAQGEIHQILLYAQNERGFRQLNELISFAYAQDQHNGEVAVNIERFTPAQCSDLLALNGGMAGDMAAALSANDKNLMQARAAHWQSIFADRFYLQISRSGESGEREYCTACAEIGQVLQMAAVATNLACFAAPEQFDVHEARVCIATGRIIADSTRPHAFTEQHYLRTQAEMAALFADAPQLLLNSDIIAQRCNVQLTLGKNFLPDFPLPEGMAIEEYLVRESERGLEERLEQLFPDAENRAAHAATYRERLHIELNVINQMGFPGYFLIVADFIQWAKDNDVPVGPGRGSGAGSLVAYALKITDLDPLAYDLLFERFLNPERVSMPDFDVDFCMEKRDRVIRYVADKYGHEKVSQIATHGTMAAKAVVRDVGRVQGKSYSFCDGVSKKIPKTLGVTLPDALGRTEKSKKQPEFFSPDLAQDYEQNEETRELIDTALQLEGLARNVGKHAGGVVIAPTKLTDFSALYTESVGAPLITQFDKDDIEAVGLVKFDFLGLRTLTVIDWALDFVNQRHAREGKAALKIEALPLDDPATFKLLKSTRTSAVFQLESSGMKNLIRKLQPDNFEDIIALVALFRPGPLQSGMVDDFINRKHGLAEVEYPHPALEGILENTYGVMVYQEQVMQVAQILANYSLGEADLLRRAMGKKKADVMAEQKAIFVERAIAGGVHSNVANDIFDLMAKFAEYGFNKSHSAAYALLSYQTAWLKAHYPAELMAAVLSSDMDKIDKVVPMVSEALDMGLEVMPPCINRSQYRFSVDEAGRILFGLGAVKGVGENAVGDLIAEREANGPYQSLLDLCRRIDLKMINKNTLESLISAGAFDVIEPNRGALTAALPQAMKLANQHHKTEQSAQQDFFGVLGGGDEGIGDELLSLDANATWTDKEKLEAEKQSLGMYLTDHPINSVRPRLQAMCDQSLAEIVAHLQELAPPADLKQRRGSAQLLRLGGMVTELRSIPSKKGGMLAFFTLDDRSARYEFMLSGKNYEQFIGLLALDKVLMLEVALEYFSWKNEWGLSVQAVSDFEHEQFRCLRNLTIRSPLAEINVAELTWLKTQRMQAAVETEQGVCQGAKVHLLLQGENYEGWAALGGRYWIEAQTLQRLEQQFGAKNLIYQY